MFFECFLAISFFDLFGGGIFGDFQDLIKLCGVDLFVVVWLVVSVGFVFVLSWMSSEKHRSTIF